MRLIRKILFTRLKEAARDALGQTPDLWHIHNHSLGKNPFLTEAVALLAESGEKILLHPHDFAEDGRPGNYLSLRSIPTGIPYRSHIHYAALNQRDRGFLAHMLKDCPSPVHLLANAVPPSTPFCQPLTGIPFPSPLKTSLYPVRAVRRKNLGELAFLPPPTQIFTLPIVSDQPTPHLTQFLKNGNNLAMNLDPP